MVIAVRAHCNPLDIYIYIYIYIVGLHWSTAVGRDIYIYISLVVHLL